MSVNSVNNVNTPQTQELKKKQQENTVKKEVQLFENKVAAETNEVGASGDADAIKKKVAEIINAQGFHLDDWNDQGISIPKLAEVMAKQGYKTEVIKENGADGIVINGMKIMDTNGNGIIELKELNMNGQLAAFAKDLKANGLGDKATDKIAEAKDLTQAKALKDEAVGAKDQALQPFQKKVGQLEERLSALKFISFQKNDDIKDKKEISGLTSQLRLAQSELTLAKIRS